MAHLRGVVTPLHFARLDLLVPSNSLRCLQYLHRMLGAGQIPAQGLIGLIEYSCQQVATSFPEVGLQRTPRLSVLGPNSEVKRAWPGEIWGWVTDREVFPGCARVRTKCAEKIGVGL